MSSEPVITLVPFGDSAELLFPSHFTERTEALRTAMDRHGVAGLLVPAGNLEYPHSDDIPYGFRVSPDFRTLLPGFERPGSYLVLDGSDKPSVFLPSADDFWHAAPPAIDEHYAQSLTIYDVADPLRAARDQLGDSSWTTFGEWGGDESLAGTVSSDVRSAIKDFADYHRGYKTAFELALMRTANQRAAAAHLAAAAAFHEGRSEYHIRAAYLGALADREPDQPYNAIVALNEHGAVLHYEQCDRALPSEHRSFLIDAGAGCGGYAADITRTYAFADGPFNELCSELDSQQRALIDEIAPGVPYSQLHARMHERIATVLQKIGVINCSVEAAVERDITQWFFPHGLGHLLGAQVHDVGGDLNDEMGRRIAKDSKYPFLRLWRPVEPGQVFTIEPGIYFIDMLLEPQRGCSEINWSMVDELKPYGGVRIEDDIAIGASGEVENLTRNAFTAL